MSRAATSKPPDRRRIVLYATVAIVVIAIIVAIGLSNRSNPVVPKAASEAPMNSKLKPGDTAPAFTAQTNAGPFDLSQVSTPVLLEVFATWCPHCQRETAALNDLARKYSGRLAIVAVSGSPYGLDGSTAESQTDVNRFGQQFQVRYPIGFDPDLKVAQLYLQGGFPTLVLIDKNKKISWMKSGEVAEGELDKAIKTAL
jgi:thiol-disulfide isomerase/thioredoxin